MSHRALRIAILNCDTPLPQTQAKYTTYGGVFIALLQAAAASLTPPLPRSALHITQFDVVTARTYPSISDIDAILLTGAKHNAFDNDPWILDLVEFVKGVLAQERVRIIGVCFGHQIVGRALGVKLGRSEKGWEASVEVVELTGRGREIFGVERLALHQMHRDAVHEYPVEVEQLAYSDKCSVQGMYVAKRLITVQGHPEFNEEIVREILTSRHRMGIFDDATFEEMMSRVGRRQDGVVVAQAFLKFLLE